jgi:hypothetical protein
VVHELGVKVEAACIEPCQMHQGDLAGVGSAKTCSRQKMLRRSSPVEPACWLAILPVSHGMAVIHFVELIERADAGVDPGQFAGFSFCGAGFDDIRKAELMNRVLPAPSAANDGASRKGMILRSSAQSALSSASPSEKSDGIAWQHFGVMAVTRHLAQDNSPASECHSARLMSVPSTNAGTGNCRLTPITTALARLNASCIRCALAKKQSIC